MIWEPGETMQSESLPQKATHRHRLLSRRQSSVWKHAGTMKTQSTATLPWTTLLRPRWDNIWHHRWQVQSSFWTQQFIAGVRREKQNKRWVFVFVCMWVMAAKESLFSFKVPNNWKATLEGANAPISVLLLSRRGVGRGWQSDRALIGLLLEGKEPNVCGRLTWAGFRVIKSASLIHREFMFFIKMLIAIFAESSGKNAFPLRLFNRKRAALCGWPCVP